MKKGIIIVLITIISILTGLNNVNADTYYTFTTNDNNNINQTEIDLLNSASYSASGLILPSRIEFSDCNGDTNCPTSINKTVYTGGTVARGITTATNGFAVSHDLLTSYAKDTLYSYTSYMCLSAPGIATSRQKLYLDSGLGATATGKWDNPADLYFTNYRYSFSYKWTHYGISGGWSQNDMQCYQWNYIFKSNVDSNTITNRYWFSAMQNINYNFVGYTIEPLGYVGDLDEQDIINIINNSGLATANSVNQVNQSVNQVKQEVQELNNSIDETNNILTGEQNYNKEASEEVNGKEEINDYTEKEEELFSNLDFEGIGNNEITINPNTSSFIWEIVEKLRGMNGKIVLLMTSILGLGIIKMILNR